jgi:mannose-6-phosphate isomerase-like protein (cupin superfamily)
MDGAGVVRALSPALRQLPASGAQEACNDGPKEQPMEAYEIAQLISQRESSNRLYLEFLKVPDLSMGLYVLPAGGADPQSPHTEDEVYYVVSGRAQILVAEENRDVQAGSIVYVAKNVAHRFHSIAEDLTVLVFFAPAEYSNSSDRQ